MAVGDIFQAGTPELDDLRACSPGGRLTLARVGVVRAHLHNKNTTATHRAAPSPDVRLRGLRPTLASAMMKISVLHSSKKVGCYLTIRAISLRTMGAFIRRGDAGPQVSRDRLASPSPRRGTAASCRVLLPTPRTAERADRTTLFILDPVDAKLVLQALARPSGAS